MTSCNAEQIEPLDERPNRADRMILRNQIVQRRHLHSNLVAFRHPQPRRTARFNLRSLLLRQILEQLLVSHRQPLLRRSTPENHGIAAMANAPCRKILTL
jgi:hypothetical protein